MSEHGHGIPSHEEIHLSPKSGWRSLPLLFGGLGLAGLVAAFATMGDAEANKTFFHAYLTSMMFWLALGLGGLFFVLVQHATRAGWSIVCRRIAEHAMFTLIPLSVLTIPVAFIGIHDLYHWSDPAHMDVVLLAKQPFLNEGFFQARAIIYMIAWAGLASMYWMWSTKQDTARDPVALTHKMRAFAPFGLIVFAFTLTFGAFDWMMSLDPHWFSTIFGVYYFGGSVITVHAFIALVVILLHRSGHLRGVVTPEHFHDLGKMMFAFTVFWTYIAFSQFMLIWYASIPEETMWFDYRSEGDFWWLSLLLVTMRFIVPFFGLMSRRIKRNPKYLAIGAVWVIAAQYVDMYWLVQPPLAHSREVTTISVGFVDLAAFIGIGGIVLAAFTWALGRAALVPTKDPRLEESINFENF